MYHFLKEIVCFEQTSNMQKMEGNTSIQYLCGC